MAAVGMEKEVASTRRLPSSRIWGRINITRIMEITVPRPRLCPMPTMAASEVMTPIRVPATAKMVPEVRMVGNAKFMVSIMASL